MLGKPDIILGLIKDERQMRSFIGSFNVSVTGKVFSYSSNGCLPALFINLLKAPNV